MPILELSPITVSKIKAGEVIERPANVVKELIENSLDAGATFITIDIEGGGKNRITVTDNGEGIPVSDLPKAPLQHTTSKIQFIEDLYSTLTYGFRGEALASMAHASNLSITSKTASQKTAFKINAHTDVISKPEPCSHPTGTCIEVKSLFFNMPVRQRFLKSDSTEFSHVFDIVAHAALAHPHIQFSLRHNRKDSLNTQGLPDLASRIEHISGKNCAKQLIELQGNLNGIEYSGMVSDPTLTFSNRNNQWFSVNGRCIKSAIMQKAVSQVFADLIPSGRFPLIVLNINLHPTITDVNIHPQKWDIRFLNSGQIFEGVKTLLNQHLGLSKVHYTPGEQALTQGVFGQQSTHELSSLNTLGTPIFQQYTPDGSAHLSLFSDNAMSALMQPQVEYLHLFDTYLVIKTAQGLCLIDQHAAHERILYEDIKKNQNNSSFKQPLLIPETITLAPDLMSLAEQELATLNELGFDIEPFGKDTVIVRAIPNTFANANLVELIIQFLTQAKTVTGHTPDLLLARKDTLQRMACKAAIKAGKRMSEPETRALINDFLSSPANYTCPHGRPLCLVWDKNHLEKLFLRT